MKGNANNYSGTESRDYSKTKEYDRLFDKCFGSTEQRGGANKLCTIIAQLKKERTAAKDHNGGTIKILTVKQTGQENGRETGQKKRRETRKHNKDPKRTEGKTGEEGKYTPSVSPSIKKQTNIYSRMLASKGNATKEVSGAMEFENPVQLYSSSSLRKNQHCTRCAPQRLPPPRPRRTS